MAAAAAIPTFVDAGFRVVAPDHRGAGHSWRPAGGYDKVTMAGDVQRLLRDHLRTARLALRVPRGARPRAGCRRRDQHVGMVVEEMMREVAGDVTGIRVPETGHWVAEENPEAFTAAVLGWLG